MQCVFLSVFVVHMHEGVGEDPRLPAAFLNNNPFPTDAFIKGSQHPQVQQVKGRNFLFQKWQPKLGRKR